MTTLDLAQRMLRCMRTTDISRMPSDEALALLDAANAGLQKAYAALPAVYRRSTITAVLRAPRAVTIGVEKYSVELTSGNFEPSDRGCTVRIGGGDAGDNEVVTEVHVLAPYLGTTGTQQATVYGDKIAIYGAMAHVTSPPRLHTGEVLCRVDTSQGRLRAAGASQGGSGGGAGVGAEVGRPRSYYLAPVGVSQDGDPMALMKVYPLPDVDYRVELECEFHPKRLTFLNLSQAVHLPIQDAVFESVLLPLCEWELAGTRFFTGDRQSAAGRRDEALTHAARIYADLFPSENRVRTPYGY
ncbi:MAG: hypothetical protein ACAI35_24450 [Candidatus Methylacidiphilales bacterium]